jgi:hypothetical protein
MNYTSVINSNEFNGLPINNGPSGEYYCYDMILHKTHERQMWMTNKHCRVLFIRFDLRFPVNYLPKGGNYEISRLFKIMKENAYNREIEVHYVWVREQSREKHQHYHCVVFINGSLVRDYRSFLGEVERVWGLVLGCDAKGLVDWCDRDRSGLPVENGIMIERPRQAAVGASFHEQNELYNNNLRRCFEWASYLAKTNQKDNRPGGIRRFNASLLR